MADVLLIILASLLLLAGILGAIIPVLPGPPLSYAGLLLIHFTPRAQFSLRFLLITGIIALLIVLIDLALPAWATRKTGGSRLGMYGAAIGLVAGIFFFPPVGIILGPFLGAFLAELTNKKTPDQAFRAAIGSFLGLLTGTLLKIFYSLIIAWYALRPVICAFQSA